jgi:small subunit ribosomal protein S6
MAKKKTETEVEKNQYEAMFLLPAGATAEMDKSLAAVKGIIERHAGDVVVLKKWDERKLAYEIKAQKRGLYIIAYFNAPAAAVSAIERDVNLSEDILRVMVTDAEHMNKDEMAAVEPQPIVPKEDRAPWDRPGFNDDGRRPRRDDRDRDRGDRDRAPRDDRAPREEKPEAAASAKE